MRWRKPRRKMTQREAFSVINIAFLKGANVFRTRRLDHDWKSLVFTREYCFWCLIKTRNSTSSISYHNETKPDNKVEDGKFMFLDSSVGANLTFARRKSKFLPKWMRTSSKSDWRKISKSSRGWSSPTFNNERRTKKSSQNSRTASKNANRYLNQLLYQYYVLESIYITRRQTSIGSKSYFFTMRTFSAFEKIKIGFVPKLTGRWSKTTILELQKIIFKRF